MQGVEGAGCRQSAVDLLPPEREGAVGLRRLRRDALEGRIALLVSSDSGLILFECRNFCEHYDFAFFFGEFRRYKFWERNLQLEE